jgi:hypothetical protein
MNFELETYHRNVPDSELIADLQRVASELRERADLQRIAPELRKESVTVREYDEIGTFCSSALARRFGSWNAAQDKAGLQRTPAGGRQQKIISNEDLFRNLEGIWTSLGRQPRYEELSNRKISAYSKGTYTKRFGSWRKALEAFISYINGEESAASDGAIEDLKDERIPKHKASRTIKGGVASLSVGSAEGLQDELIVSPRGPRNPGRRLTMQVLIRDKGICQLCKRVATADGLDYHIDHITPWIKGGPTVLSNLQLLCSKCNLIKGDLDLTKFTEG